METKTRRRPRARALVGVTIVGLSLLGAAPLTDLRVPTLRHLPDVADARSLLPSAMAVPASIPTRQPGYQLVTNAGDVLPFGSAPVGSAPAPLANGVAGVAWTADGGGHWLATRDGGVFTFGDAAFHGSAGGAHLRSPIAGIASTRTGNGYWLVAADGGVFSFGDAKFYGSAAKSQLRAPIVGVAPTVDGGGYWLASADGGVFSFGDAAFHGAASHAQLRAPIVGIAATHTGNGYWLAAAEGGVFTFGDAAFRGGVAGKQLLSPIVGIATTRTGKGYWLAAADGGVFTFGDAPFLGSSGGGVWGSVVGIAGGAAQPKVAAKKLGNRQLTTRFGHDISWPQCGDPYPKKGYGYAVIGVTRGHPFSVNECLADQWRWAVHNGSGGALYLNLASIDVGAPAAMAGPAGACSISDLPCQAYNGAANNVLGALDAAKRAGAGSAPVWWLDVEVGNRWSPAKDLNALVVKAAAETLVKAGKRAGIYSSPGMWQRITGGAQLGLPVWVAGAPTDAAAITWCNADHSFNGGQVWLVQSLPVEFDHNWACSAVAGAPASAFAFRK